MHCDGERVELNSPPEEYVDYLNKIWEKLRFDAYGKNEPSGINKYGAKISSPSPIEVNDCDFQAKDNAKSHNTDKYDLLGAKSPIFRRGEPFHMTIEFNRAFDMDSDVVKLKLIFGPEDKGLNFVLTVTSSKAFTKEASEWDIALFQQESTVLTVQIQIPHTTFVGLWRLQVISQIKENEESKTHDCKENIYILFNPWCKEDPFYMDDDKNREIYVLSDVGKMYTGSEDNFIGIPWAFDQFAEVVLPASIFILEKSDLDFAKRGDPVEVARAISTQIKHRVIVGKWDKKYDDGTNPHLWTGSAPILEQFFSRKGDPVKYGQCWVFAGTCNTVYRALGIPGRVVTNFSSAHDDDQSLVVEKFLDADGNRGKKDTEDNDFEWNYHVWNEFWVTRVDIPNKEYSGWQAMDGSFGPAPLIAIKKGEIKYNYDVAHMFAVVNADVILFKHDKDSDEWTFIKKDTAKIGRKIITRKPGIELDSEIDDLEDLTLTYKFKEGTAEEREIFVKTLKESQKSVRHLEKRPDLAAIYDESEPDIGDVDFKVPRLESVMIGKDIRIIIHMENTSDEKRTVTTTISVSCENYDAEIARKKIKYVKEKVSIERKQKKELKIDVKFDDYEDKLMDNSMLEIYVVSTISETKKNWGNEINLNIEKPSLNIKIEGKATIKKSFNLEISFTNPLERTLEDCSLTINGSGLKEPLKISIDNIEPKKKMTHTESITASEKTGFQIISAIFWSKQLTGVHGSKTVYVEE